MKLQHFVFVFILVSLISFSCAEVQTLGTFKQNTNVSLIQICDNCSYNKITSILFPNGTYALKGEYLMTRTGTDYNFTFNDSIPQPIGRYIVNGYGDLDGKDTVWSYDFEVNAIGFESNDARTQAANRGFYFIFGLSFIFFLLFALTPQESEIFSSDGMVTVKNRIVLKWTWFLLAILFLMLGSNITFISIYNDIGDNQMGAIFDKLAAISSYLFWFVFGLMLFIWVYATIATLGDKIRMKQAKATGQPTGFN